MSDKKITPTQVEQIEHALEERKQSNDRRDTQTQEEIPSDVDRRDEKSSDRRKQS